MHFRFDFAFQVSRYLDAPDIITGNTTPMDPAVKQRLLRHLDSCVSELDLDLGSRPDSGLGSSPGSVTDRVTGSGSPGPLEHHVPSTAHCSTSLNPVGLIKAEIPDIEPARPDSSTTAGDENNNNSNSSSNGNSRPTSAFGQVNTTNLDSHHHHPPPPPPPGISVIDQASSSQQNPNMLSVVQVIPSRLPDGQVVFLLPSHYVQLAAAAAANGISIGPNPPTAIWAATNMSLLKATDKLAAKRPHEDIQEWQDAATVAVNAAAAAVAATVAAAATSGNASVSASISASAPVSTFATNAISAIGTKPSKSPRLEQPEQPLDFTTTSKKPKPSTKSSITTVSNIDHFQQQQQQQQQQPQQPQQQSQIIDTTDSCKKSVPIINEDVISNEKLEEADIIDALNVINIEDKVKAKESERRTELEADGKNNEVMRRKKGNLKSSTGKANLSRRVSFDPLALLLDASLEGELELVKKTAKEVANPSSANDEGITALHNAICAGHLEIVKFLVEFGCDVNAQDSDGW